MLSTLEIYQARSQLFRLGVQPERGSRDEAPIGGLWGKAPGFFSPNNVLIDARRAIQNRFITEFQFDVQWICTGQGQIVGDNR